MKYKSFIGGEQAYGFIPSSSLLTSIPVSIAACVGLDVFRFYYYEKKSRKPVCGGLFAQLLFGISDCLLRALRINSSRRQSANGIGGNLFGRIHLLFKYYKSLTRRICP